MHKVRILIGIALLAMLATVMFAQTDAARLEGTVQDPTGSVVPNAKLKLINNKTLSRAEISSDAAGNFIFASVLPGTYELTAEAGGFRKSSLTNLERNVGAIVA